MVRIWDPRAGRPIGDPLRFIERSVCVVAPVHLPDEGFAVGVGLVNGRIQIWSVDSGVLLGETEPSSDGFGFDTQEVRAICSLSCPGGPVVAASSTKRGVRIWSTANIVGRFRHYRRAVVTALAPVPGEVGETLLACAYSSGLLDLVDAATGAIVHSLDATRGKAILSLTASVHNGRSLVAAATGRRDRPAGRRDARCRHEARAGVSFRQTTDHAQSRREFSPYGRPHLHGSLGPRGGGSQRPPGVRVPYAIEAMASVSASGEYGVVAAIVGRTGRSIASAQ